MKSKVESETELTEVNTRKINDVELNGNGEAKKEKDPITWFERIQNIFNFFTVEPFLLCYILPSVIAALAVQKLNMEKACRTDLNYSEEICSLAIAGEKDNITSEALNGAQKLVADMTAWTQPVQSGIPAIVILFVGAWSDKTGNRKALMLVPILGEIVSGCLLLLTTYYFLEWPLWATGLIESLPTALAGGWSIALMGSYSYIADVTTVESRTFRIGIVAVIVTLGVPLGSSISGILTQLVGYYGIFGIGIALYVIGFIHTYFRIHDVRKTDTVIEGTIIQKIIQFFHPKNIWDTFSLLFVSRGKRLVQIILVICAHIVIIGPVFGEGAVLFLYTLNKYSMDVVDFSLFTTYSVLMGLIGTAVAVTVFSKRLKMHDAVLGMIASTSKVTSSIVYGLAPSRNWFFAGPAFDFFGNSGVTAIRSLGTKIVEPDEVDQKERDLQRKGQMALKCLSLLVMGCVVMISDEVGPYWAGMLMIADARNFASTCIIRGKICSLIGFAEAIVPVIYTPIYSTVYSKTIKTFSGAFYLLGGIMTVPAFFIFLYLYILHRKQRRDEVKNPDAKEMYTHENAITSL